MLFFAAVWAAASGLAGDLAPPAAGAAPWDLAPAAGALAAPAAGLAWALAIWKN